MSQHKFQMSINLQVLNHLGLNLYSNTSAVLSEVVANAWDADATIDIMLDFWLNDADLLVNGTKTAQI